MNTQFKTLMAIITIFLCGHFYALASQRETNDGETIVIVYHETSPEFTPRGPVYVPFSAMYTGAGIYLVSDTNIGTVAVEVCSTAGDWTIVPFDTSCGSIVIPVSGEEGHYSLTITTAGGMVYEGEFDIM